jgi:hypothetical protein
MRRWLHAVHGDFPAMYLRVLDSHARVPCPRFRRIPDFDDAFTGQHGRPHTHQHNSEREASQHFDLRFYLRQQTARPTRVLQEPGQSCL